MIPALFFYQLVLVALVWLCLMLQWVWPSDRVTAQPTPPPPTPPRHKWRCEPTPFVGLTTKPHCDACDQAHAPHPWHGLGQDVAASHTSDGRWADQ